MGLVSFEGLDARRCGSGHGHGAAAMAAVAPGPRRRPGPRAASAAATAPCGLLAAQVEESGFRLRGVAPPGEADSVRRDLAARKLPAGATRVEIGTFNAPLCPLVAALRPALASPAEAPSPIRGTFRPTPGTSPHPTARFELPNAGLYQEVVAHAPVAANPNKNPEKLGDCYKCDVEDTSMCAPPPARFFSSALCTTTYIPYSHNCRFLAPF